jgi:hypothetical protein
MSNQPLSKSEIISAIRQATSHGESVDSYALHDRLCRRDATGRLSRSDGECFDSTLNEMVESGEIRKTGPFISSAARD